MAGGRANAGPLTVKLPPFDRKMMLNKEIVTLYEFSYHETGRFLNLVEKEDGADGTMDILFTSSANKMEGANCKPLVRN